MYLENLKVLIIWDGGSRLIVSKKRDACLKRKYDCKYAHNLRTTVILPSHKDRSFRKFQIVQNDHVISN
jgi:hypothetical protein